MLRRIMGATLGSLAVLAAVPAFAQDSRVEIFSTEEKVAVEFGGGVLDYLDGIDDVTDLGAAATVRAIVLPESAISAEIAYVGSFNELFSEDETLTAGVTTHIGEALVRFTPLKVARIDTKVQPYVAGGAGYLTHQITGEDRKAVEFSSTQLFEMPAAIGVFGEFENLSVDGRVSYRYIFDDDLRDDAAKTDVQSWTAMLTAGMTF